ncbi:MAG: glycosyltransferase family 2 protein [Paludibacter sp.]
MQPIVSILVPVYKVEAHIEKCAVSLFSQTFESIQYVYVNDCTPDSSIEVLERILTKFPKRANQVSIIHHEQNKGIGATRNTLLHAATGKYIFWVDSDDFIKNDAVEKLVENVENSDADLVTTDSYFFYNGENNTKIFRQNFPTDSKKYIEAIGCHQARAALWGTISKRSLWIDNQIEIQNSSRFGEDYFATIQLFYFAKRISCIQLPFYYYNQTNINAYTRGYKSENHFVSMIQLFEKLTLFFQKQNKLEEYVTFLLKARITEFSGLLLHTTAELRMKYKNVIDQNELLTQYQSVGLSQWQFFILKQIVSGKNVISSLLLVLAKILRAIFKINF